MSLPSGVFQPLLTATANFVFLVAPRGFRTISLKKEDISPNFSLIRSLRFLLLAAWRPPTIVSKFFGEIQLAPTSFPSYPVESRISSPTTSMNFRMNSEFLLSIETRFFFLLSTQITNRSRIEFLFGIAFRSSSSANVMKSSKTFLNFCDSLEAVEEGSYISQRASSLIVFSRP